MEQRRILNSWKEIAAYIGRGVRTVQRYELQFGFPVHRPAGMSRSSVMGFSDEIDTWLAKTPSHWQQFVRGTEPSELPADGSNGNASDASVCPLCHGTGKLGKPYTGATRKSEKPFSGISRTA
jgi:hypothetical protein